MADDGHIHGVHFVAFEAAPFAAGLHPFHQFFVLHVEVLARLGVVEMQVAGGIHIEEHLAAYAEAVRVDPQKGHLGEDIVDGSGGDFRSAFADDAGRRDRRT